MIGVERGLPVGSQGERGEGEGEVEALQGHVYWEARLAFGPRMWHGYTGI